MSAEHIRFVQQWMREHVGDRRPLALRGESVYATLDRLRPPALVRACWLLVEEHVRNGIPVSLAPSVAEVYVADADAFPATSCDGCGYLMPTRSKIHPPGTYRHIGWYLGTCPVCGLDNHPEEETPG
jgi:hypothetical protein